MNLRSRASWVAPSVGRGASSAAVLWAWKTGTADMQWSTICLSGLLTISAGLLFEILTLAVGLSELPSFDGAGRHPTVLTSQAGADSIYVGCAANDDGEMRTRRRGQQIVLPGRLVQLFKNLIVSAALVVAFTTVRAVMNSQLAERSPYMLYILPVALAALFCGPRSGAVVMLSAGAIASYAFVPPQGGWRMQDGDLYALIMFWLASGAVVLLGSSLRVSLLERVARTGRRPF